MHFHIQVSLHICICIIAKKRNLFPRNSTVFMCSKGDDTRANKSRVYKKHTILITHTKIPDRARCTRTITQHKTTYDDDGLVSISLCDFEPCMHAGPACVVCARSPRAVGIAFTCLCSLLFAWWWYSEWDEAYAIADRRDSMLARCCSLRSHHIPASKATIASVARWRPIRTDGLPKNIYLKIRNLSFNSVNS